MEFPVYNKDGKEVGKASLSDAVFGLKWNSDLVHQVVIGQAANQRQGTAHAKGRSEVRGGGRKPWKQKGTGRARHGSIRSPLWKGGGVTHGPLAEKNYEKKINRRMAKKALFTVLSQKARENEILVLDEMLFPEAKTKRAAEFFSNFANASRKKILKGNGVLVLTHGKDDVAYRAIRNLPYAAVSEARNINARAALEYTYIFMPRAAAEAFKK